MSRRILIINPLWPHPAHSVRAANVVVYELVAEFAKHKDLKIGFLKVGGPGSATRTPAEDEGVKQLELLGVDFLEPFIYSPDSILRSRLGRWFFPVEADFYPEANHRAAAEKAAQTFGPDLIFIPWSETTTCLFADMKVKKFAYYGNPDAKAGRARADFIREHGGGNISYLRQRFQLGRLERFHLSIMSRYDYLGDVAMNDAEYYQHHGHLKAFYVRNLWVDRFGTSWRSRRRDAERNQPFVIVGNLGQLGATANTHGLEILGREIVPALRHAMGDRKFEVHIFGGGTLNPAIVEHLQLPEIRIRGFVEDIDDEMITSPVFLCMNNASRYKVGHTRYLHAWSLGCCVVAHRDAALSMPEMISGKNCLLGNSPAEIADMVSTVANDASLRGRLGEEGYATFLDKFTAAPVVDDILSRAGIPHFANHEAAECSL